ncbi:collagen-like protein [Ruminococcus sp. AF12-5]|nr:collagen-like protein [Ruminococcus sp. AF12-5]
MYGDKGNTGATGPQGVKGDKGNTGPQGPQGVKGDKGDKGNTGAAGKGVKSTAITYQASTSGVVTPTGTWSTTIPAVSAGSYLWTRTIITYTDNNTSTSYSVGKMGNTGAQGPKGDTGAQGPKGDKGNTGATGAAGKGIKSTAVTYQAGMTGVAVPTGTWSTTIPSTSASKPYLWSRTIITYTDNTTSTTYSVGSTADSVQVGGRNLMIDSDNLSKWIYKGVGGYDAEVKECNTTKYPSGRYTECKCTKAGTGLYISAGCYNNTNKIMKGDTVTLSGWVYCSVDKGLLSPTIEFASNITWKVRPKLCTTWSYFECTIVSRTDIPTETGGVAICFYNTFAVNEVIAFSSFKLEKGNKATDWTPAPEDLIKSITEANTAIEQVDEKISMKASTETVTEIANKANNLDKALTDAKTVIQQNSDAIASLTARDFKVEFTTITKQLESLNGDLSSYKEEIGNWMRFDADGNLVLGATRVPGQDSYELKLTKNRISFMLNDDEVAYISNNELYITNSTVVQNLKIGRFVWEIRGNGNLGLIWR